MFEEKNTHLIKKKKIESAFKGQKKKKKKIPKCTFLAKA
jgi:hypothetical protein